MASESNNKDTVDMRDKIFGMPRWFVILVLILILAYIIYVGYKNGHFAGLGGPNAGKMYHVLVPQMEEFECVSEFVLGK